MPIGKKGRGGSRVFCQKKKSFYHARGIRRGEKKGRELQLPVIAS